MTPKEPGSSAIVSPVGQRLPFPLQIVYGPHSDTVIWEGSGLPSETHVQTAPA